MQILKRKQNSTLMGTRTATARKVTQEGDDNNSKVRHAFGDTQTFKNAKNKGYQRDGVNLRLPKEERLLFS